MVTGGGPGVGRAIVDQLLSDADDNSVVTMEPDGAAFSWTENHRAGARAIPVLGDASDEAVAERAADLAEEIGALEGWVNNAAVFNLEELLRSRVSERDRQELVTDETSGSAALRSAEGAAMSTEHCCAL